LKRTLYDWCIANDKNHLLKEWYYSDNQGLGPKDYAPKSSKVVWWKCSKCGNIWEAKIVKRSDRNYGCPVCRKEKQKKAWMNTKLKKMGSLLKNRPEIAKEWHPTKNALIPDNVLSGSNKKVWWKCETCGHQWQAQIAKRTVRNQGCPVCGIEKGKKAWMDAKIDKMGSLVDNAKLLVQEWHPTRNGDAIPDEYLSGSNKKVWWSCKVCGHEWEAEIKSRVDGAGCPKCGQIKGKKTLLKNLIMKKGSLFFKNPNLASDWHPTKNGDLSPQDVMENTNKSVWWKCKKCGKEWQASISNRNSGGGMCPKCHLDDNDLLSQNPKLASQWHPTKNGDLLPECVTQNSNRKVWWLGKCGHEWQAVIASRNNGRNCPECLKEYKVSYPEKVIFFYLRKILYDYTVKENYKADWLQGKELDMYIPKYNLGVEYDGSYWHNEVSKDIEKDELCYGASIDLIRIREEKSPTYVGKNKTYHVKSESEDDLIDAISFIIEYINEKYHTEYIATTDISEDRIQIYELLEMNKKNSSLGVLYPQIASEWHPTKNGKILPEYVSAHSHRKVWWLGECGHEYDAPIRDRTERDVHCPFCSSHRILKGFNDLHTVNPELAGEWHPTKNGNLKPSDVLPYSNKKVWWVCKKGHPYNYLISHRSNGSKCPVCSERRVLQGVNDLVTINQHIADEWNYERNINIFPNEFTTISSKKVWWKSKNSGYE